jgi:hypothetical protein
MKRILALLILAAGTMAGAQQPNPSLIPWYSATPPTICSATLPIYVIANGFAGAGNFYGNANTGPGTSCSLLNGSGGSGTVTSSGSPVLGNISKFTTATNIAPAAASDIVGLFSGTCTGSNYLGADGACHAAGSGGLSGMTQYGLPVAATPSTVTSSVQPASFTTGYTFLAGWVALGSPLAPTAIDASTLVVSSAATVASVTGATGNIAGTSGGLSGSPAITVSSCTGCGTVTIANGTATLGTGAISSATCASVVTVAGSGIATTDVLGWGFNADPTSTTGYSASTSGMLTIIAYPTSGNANFKVCNNTSGSITPGATTLNWKVAR